ncbi:AAA family ATPase [Microbacterium aurum]
MALTTPNTHRGYTTTIEHARHYIDLQRITGRSTAEVRARQSEFQRAVVDMQIEQEHSLDPQHTVFLDRALPDSLAYYRFLNLRVEKTQAMSIALADEDAEVQPVPGAGAVGHRDPALERLSEIVKSFNALFGNIDWQDAERIC